MVIVTAGIIAAITGAFAWLGGVASSALAAAGSVLQAFFTFLNLLWSVFSKYQEWISTHFPASDKNSISKLIIVLFIVLCIIAWMFGGL